DGGLVERQAALRCVGDEIGAGEGETSGFHAGGKIGGSTRTRTQTQRQRNGHHHALSRRHNFSQTHTFFEDGRYYYQWWFHVIRNTPNNLLKMILRGWESKYAWLPRGVKRFLVPDHLAFMRHAIKTAPVLGVICSNNNYFPDQLITEARRDVEQLFARFGIKAIQLSEADSKLGGVETHAEARKCAELFRRHADEIDGVLVCLPNFGDEKGVADTLKMSKLNVPVLIQGYPDDLKQLSPARRRDAFCGKISVCNNLVQAGIQFSLTSKHVSHPTSESFSRDFQNFLGVCRVVNGLRGVRLGAVGARPGAFNTVRYSEKLLERYGISVTTVD